MRTAYSPAGASDLLDGLDTQAHGPVPLADGAVLLRGFASDESPELIASLRLVTEAAPFRHMVTPGGFRMSVAMSNCGSVGWVTERSGYRYSATDPITDKPWPEMPASFAALARRAAAEAGYADYIADSCLINRYEPGAKLSLHQDRDEADYVKPIVSVSLGLPATFLFGGLERGDRPRRYRMLHSDVAVWGGASRLAYHGIDKLADGEHPLTGHYRFNLTFRRAR